MKKVILGLVIVIIAVTVAGADICVGSSGSDPSIALSSEDVFSPSMDVEFDERPPLFDVNAEPVRLPQKGFQYYLVFLGVFFALLIFLTLFLVGRLMTIYKERKRQISH